MSGWRIDPAGVAGVIAGVDGDAALLEEATGPGRLSGIMRGLSWGEEFTVAVADALGVGVTSQADRVRSAKARVAAGRVGAVAATNAYGEANLEMAAEVQAQAQVAAQSGDFTWFEAGGR